MLWLRRGKEVEEEEKELDDFRGGCWSLKFSHQDEAEFGICSLLSSNAPSKWAPDPDFRILLGGTNP